MEYLDIVDDYGQPTGEIIERGKAHKEGVLHRTSHVWLVRERNQHIELLLQKRCEAKESFPGCYDISSAGHIPAGVDFVPSAIRELKEELGMDVHEGDLKCCGDCKKAWDGVFNSVPFHDREYSRVFIMWCDLDEQAFHLQKEEVSEVRWMKLEQVIRSVNENLFPNCIYPMELQMVRHAVKIS